jgi:RimJ/RimL family protein N-acetyltransferase
MSSISDKQTLAGLYIDLRPLTADDAELTFAWRQGARATLLNRGAQTIEQQHRWIAGRPASERNFIIETKQHRPIGMLSLTGIDAVNRVGEPGRFLIGDEPAAAGLPAAAEAIKLLYQLAFDTLKLRRLWGFVASENRRMIKWQTFLGMTQEGRLRQHLFINGRLQDAVVFGLLDSEYRSVTLPRLESLIAAARLPVAPSVSFVSSE